MQDKTKSTSFFYDQLRNNEWKHVADFGPSTRARYRIILKLLIKYSTQKDSIIDVGCGSGNLLKLLFQNGYHNISGSDFSFESIKIAKQKAGDVVFQADLSDENSFKHKYNFVICSEVLEHIQNDVHACSTLYNLLDDNGCAIISVPAHQKYWSAHDGFSGHVRRYEPKQLESILMNQGFSILSSHYWGSGIYSLYHFILRKLKPANIMNAKRPGFYKKTFAKILYYVFTIEEYYSFPTTAKRLFLVVKKNSL